MARTDGAKIRTIIDNKNFLVRKITNSPFAYLWYNLDYAARIVALLIYLNLDSDAFLKFFYVGYDADMMTRLGGKSEEKRGEILNIFNDIYRKRWQKVGGLEIKVYICNYKIIIGVADGCPSK